MKAALQVIADATNEVMGTDFITSELMQSSYRKHEVVVARTVYCYLMKKLTKQSFRSIGEQIGGRNHATVFHAVNRVKKADPNYARIYHKIIDKCQIPIIELLANVNKSKVSEAMKSQLDELRSQCQAIIGLRDQCLSDIVDLLIEERGCQGYVVAKVKSRIDQMIEKETQAKIESYVN